MSNPSSPLGPDEARREVMEPSPAKGKPQGRLLVSTTLDAKDELEEVGLLYNILLISVAIVQPYST